MSNGTDLPLPHGPLHDLIVSLSATIHRAVALLQTRRAADDRGARDDAARVEVLAREFTQQIEALGAANGSLLDTIKRVDALADGVPQVIWANEADGRASYFNRRWYEYSGLTFEESAGPGWEVLVHPDDAVASKQKWQEALAAGEIFDCEYRLQRHDGQYRWFIGRNVPLRDGAGRITAWFGTATDIHELKETQFAANQREQQFRQAIEDAPIPVILQAEDGEVLQVNAAWRQLTGFEPGETSRLSGWSTDPFAYRADAIRAFMHQLFTSGQAPAHTEFEIVTHTGEHRHLLFSASVPGTLNVNDRRKYAVGMAIDLTDRKRTETALAISQERLRLIVESAVEHAIISMDLNRNVTSWNSGAERMLGFSREEMIHRMSDIMFTAEDRANGGPQSEMEVALAQGRSADERWHVRKDGSLFWGSGVMLPMRELPDGPVTGFIKILRDETEKREAGEALEASRRELLDALRETDRARADAEAATRAKDHFLAVLSHELRTPLTPVLLATATLSRHKDLPERVRDALAMIRRNVELEAQLVDDLLDVTRIVHGKMELMRETVDVHDVVNRAVSIIRPTADMKSQRLIAELTAERHHLSGDATRLQQVVWNLLGNASKFSPTGGEIRVLTRNEASSFLIEVSDNGIGIEPEALTRIFDTFAQASVRITREFGGLGLGLSISKATVEAHGGSLRAESAGRERGATFIVTLPLPSGE